MLLYIEPCGRPRHEIINKTITRAYNLPRPRAGDKKTKYTTHNTTSIVNVTSYANRTVLENARPQCGNLKVPARTPSARAGDNLRNDY